jgi:peptidoglycan/LPS O-acetylase OafA/YrhL
VWVHTFSVGDTTWNGSLWSLPLEVLCYLGVAAVGLCAIHRRGLIFAVVAAFGLLDLAYARTGVTDLNGLLPLMARSALMFSLGALLHLYRNRIPYRPWLAIAAAITVATAATFTSSYRSYAGLAFAYLLLYGGISLGRFGGARVEDDLSYGVYLYGYPVQTLLVACGLGGLVWPLFVSLSAVLVMPLATASWLLVERPSLHRSRTADYQRLPTSR